MDLNGLFALSVVKLIFVGHQVYSVILEKQISVFTNLHAVKYQATEGSYKVALYIAKHGKPFTNGEYIKEAFLSSLQALFDGLPNKDTIISKIKYMSASARAVERSSKL